MRASYTRPLLLAGVLIILSGCAQTPRHGTQLPAVPNNTPHTPLPVAISERLTEQSGYTAIQSELTHWGNSIQLEASPIYYAASGRICREISVSQSHTSLREEVIACNYGSHWGVTRNVTKALEQGRARR